MSINIPLLQMVITKNINTTSAQSDISYDMTNNTEISNCAVDEMLAANSNATIYSIADEIATQRITLSDNAVFIASDSIIKSNFAVTISTLTPSEISNIKSAIYDYFHRTSSGGTGGTGGTDGTGGTGGTDSKPEEGGETGGSASDKASFLNDFGDTETMFEYMHKIDPNITKQSGISRTQLYSFTQNDRWEDANYDFFGSLNRIFDILDKDNDDTLSFDEIQNFIGEELGSDFLVYKNKVNTYAAEIQQYYETLSNQAKLEFAIEQTRIYLEAAGLTNQLVALERLLGQTDSYNTVKVGQIAMADLNPGYTGGAYTLGCYAFSSYAGTYNGQDFTVFISDEDTVDANGDQVDLGLTLDIGLLNWNWYELVDTLVHELTHATAYMYSSFFTSGDSAYYRPPSQDIIDRLHDLGALNDSDYVYYSQNVNSLSYQSPEMQKFFWLVSSASGEYMAYQTDADYVDSIAGDVYDGAGSITTAVNGASEKDTIMSHVDTHYNDDDNTEPIPDWQWWTYA